MGPLMGRMHFCPSTIHIILNFDGDCDGNEHGVGTSKQTLKVPSFLHRERNIKTTTSFVLYNSPYLQAQQEPNLGVILLDKQTRTS